MHDGILENKTFYKMLLYKCSDYDRLIMLALYLKFTNKAFY